MRSLLHLRWLIGVAVVAVLVLGQGGDSVGVSSPGFTIGRENSWFRVQNVGNADATIGAAYMDESGTIVDSDTYYGIKYARSAPPFFQATNTALPHGFRGSSTIFSNRSVGALLFRSITDTGSGLHRFGGVSTTVPKPAKRVYLPLVMRNYGYGNAWNSRIIIMNTSATTTACVGLSFWRSGGGDFDANNHVPRHPANYGSCVPVPPLATYRFDGSDMTALGNQWIGSVMVDVTGAEDPPGSKQIIVANAEVWNTTRGTFSSYSGVCWRHPSTCSSLSGAATNLLVPLIYRGYGNAGQWESFLAIQTDDAKTADVRIEFDGYANGVPVQTTYGPFTVNTGRVCYLSSPEPVAACADEGTSEGVLPTGFIGSARILEETSAIPLAVIATRSSNRFDNYSTYTAFWEKAVGDPTDPPTTYTVYVPLTYRAYGWKGFANNGKGWNSWFQIQVDGDQPAQVTITYFRDNGSIAATRTATVTNFATFYQFAETALGYNYIGSARIISDQPIAVVNTVTSDVYVGDADASFEGIPP